MKKTVFLIMGWAILFSSCKKNNPVVGLLSGSYIGIFQRLSMAYQGPDSVKINFSGSRFSGAPLTANSPEICNGSYSIFGDSVKFSNDCLFSLPFDETLLLSGKYRIYYTTDSLRIVRLYHGTEVYSDTYTLKKQ